MYINETNKNTAQTVQNRVNTSGHITKTPTHYNKPPHTHTLQNQHIHTTKNYKITHKHTHTLQNPHIHTPTLAHIHTLQNPHTHTHTYTHTHTHTLQNKLKQPQ